MLTNIDVSNAIRMNETFDEEKYQTALREYHGLVDKLEDLQPVVNQVNNALESIAKPTMEELEDIRSNLIGLGYIDDIPALNNVHDYITSEQYVEDALCSISSFIKGMVKYIIDLIKRLYKYLVNAVTLYNLKKRNIVKDLEDVDKHVNSIQEQMDLGETVNHDVSKGDVGSIMPDETAVEDLMVIKSRLVTNGKMYAVKIKTILDFYKKEKVLFSEEKLNKSKHTARNLMKNNGMLLKDIDTSFTAISQILSRPNANPAISIKGSINSAINTSTSRGKLTALSTGFTIDAIANIADSDTEIQIKDIIPSMRSLSKYIDVDIPEMLKGYEDNLKNLEGFYEGISAGIDKADPILNEYLIFSSKLISFHQKRIRAITIFLNVLLSELQEAARKALLFKK